MTSATMTATMMLPRIIWARLSINELCPVEMQLQ